MEFVGNVSLGDLERAWGAMSQIDASPARLAGRLAGLGTAELDAGIPTWAWVAVAFGAGAAVAFVYSDDLRDRVTSLWE